MDFDEYRRMANGLWCQLWYLEKIEMLCGLGVFHISEVSDGLSVYHLISNGHLVGGWALPLFSKYEFVNGKDYLIDEMESHKSRVWNHRPAILIGLSWVSCIWILRPFWDDFPYKNHDSQGSLAVRSWSNLPKYQTPLELVGPNGMWSSP